MTTKSKQDFNNINWHKCNKEIANMQEKLVIAFKNGEKEKVIKIQKLIVKSFSGRALAVKKVITNRGSKTDGIDNEIWETKTKRMKAITELLTNKYKAKPLKRIYIPKDNGGKRPLSIPTMYDRAMQALYALTLDPIAETNGDSKSYGFRKYRCCQDAIKYCHNILSKDTAPKYILEGDIKGFFDNINHEWIMDNIPMDKVILKEFLKAGFLELNNFKDTESGIPQGGIISPIIANMVLDGLEIEIKESLKSLKGGKNNQKVNYVRYADDFIVTAKSEEIITETIIPTIENFLNKRGVKLNMEKTKITNIEKGFDFLGFSIRKYEIKEKDQTGKIIRKLKLLTKPSTKSIQKFRKKISEVIKRSKTLSSVQLTLILNPIIRGWANYFSSGASKAIFTAMDDYIWYKIWKWAVRKHPNIGKRKIKELYFKKVGNRDWSFPKEEGSYLLKIATIPIIRHILCANFNPYLSENQEYFENRRQKLHIDLSEIRRKIYQKTKGLCLVCQMPLEKDQELDLHHILSKKEGGAENINNLLLLHSICHQSVTFNRNSVLKARNQKLGITKEKSKDS